MKKVWTDADEVWKRMGWMVIGLACAAYACVLMHWFQNPELSQMGLLMETWKFQICGLILTLLGIMMICLKGSKGERHG